jgi:electron transfer flavoprotein beta subunit
LRVLVCVKQVPDTEARLTISGDGVSVAERDVKFIVNPYDEIAIEEGVRIKEQSSSDTTVDLVTVGPPRADDALRVGLAMGADSATRVWDEALARADGAAVARVLEAVARQGSFDLVLCGRVSIDDALGEVPLRLAARLGVPHANAVTKLVVEAQHVNASAEIEGGTAVVEMDLPAVLTVQRGLNEPRYPAIPAIMRARRMPIEVLDLERLGIDRDVVVASSRSQVVGLSEPPGRGAGRIIEAETPQLAARQLALLLRDEAKVL